eukprot:COSAG04_NODE_15768_length_521_cov_0.822275_1_plen_70_part_10
MSAPRRAPSRELLEAAARRARQAPSQRRSHRGKARAGASRAYAPPLWSTASYGVAHGHWQGADHRVQTKR